MSNPKLNRDILSLHDIYLVEERGGDKDEMPPHVERIKQGLLDFRSIIPAEDRQVRAPGLLPLQPSSIFIVAEPFPARATEPFKRHTKSLP
jgi:hypothetical protein